MIVCRVLSRLYPAMLPNSCVRVGKGLMEPSRALTRSLVVLCSNTINSSKLKKTSSSLCSCGCGIHGIHTRGDRELVEFLQEEITAEKKNVQGSLPSHVDDFKVKSEAAEITLNKSFHDEEITITLNVNHSVDSESPVKVTGDENNEVELKSRPSFEVDIKVGSKVMSFTCSFMGPADTVEGQDQVDDVFGINELTIYEGEWSEATYCVSGDILDGMMYDLLMNMLEERGVTNDFAEKLSLICSDYEHSLYVNLLQKVQDFVKRK